MRPFILQSVQQRIKISVWEQGETTQLVNNVRISPTNDAMRCLLCSGCASALKTEMGRGWSLGHSPSLEELCVPVMLFHIPFESSDQQMNAGTVSFCFVTALFGRCHRQWVTGLQGCCLFFLICGAFRWWFCIDCITPCAQLLTVSAKLGKLDPTQCCWNCEAEVFKNQEKPDLWLCAQLADAHCAGFMCQPSVVSCGIEYPNLNQSELQSHPQNLKHEVQGIKIL